MNRRNFLSSIGVGTTLSLSGCLEIAGIAGDNEGHFEIVNISENHLPSDYVSFDTEIIDRESTDDKPPKIEISATNIGEMDFNLSGSSVPVFGGQISEGEDMVLLRPNQWSDENIDNRSDCWKLDNTIPINLSEPITSLNEGQTRSIIFDLIGHYENSGCISEDSYEFSTNYDLNLEGQEFTQSQTSFNWGFDVEIRKI